MFVEINNWQTLKVGDTLEPKDRQPFGTVVVTSVDLETGKITISRPYCYASIHPSWGKGDLQDGTKFSPLLGVEIFETNGLYFQQNFDFVDLSPNLVRDYNPELED